MSSAQPNHITFRCSLSLRPASDMRRGLGSVRAVSGSWPHWDFPHPLEELCAHRKKPPSLAQSPHVSEGLRQASSQLSHSSEIPVPRAAGPLPGMGRGLWHVLFPWLPLWWCPWPSLAPQAPGCSGSYKAGLTLIPPCQGILSQHTADTCSGHQNPPWSSLLGPGH